jgi:hypothetical protein
MPLIRTVGHPGPTTGPPVCGTGGVPGVTIGHTCMSLIRAAGFPMRLQLFNIVQALVCLKEYPRVLSFVTTFSCNLSCIIKNRQNRVTFIGAAGYLKGMPLCYVGDLKANLVTCK